MPGRDGHAGFGGEIQKVIFLHGQAPQVTVSKNSQKAPLAVAYQSAAKAFAGNLKYRITHQFFLAQRLAVIRRCACGL